MGFDETRNKGFIDLINASPAEQTKIYDRSGDTCIPKAS